MIRLAMLPLAVVLAVALSPSADNLLANGGFEDGLAHWNVGSYHVDPALDDGIEEIVTDGCLSGRCLKLSRVNSTWQGASQSVGELIAGQTYELRVHFRTSATHYGHSNLHNPMWRNGACEAAGRSTIRQMPGTGAWAELVQVVRIPSADECGPISGQSWGVYLYSYAPVTDSSPVLYDEVTLSPVDDRLTVALEEDAELGIVTCQSYTDDLPLVPCPDDVATLRHEPASGARSLQIRGTRDIQESLTFDIPVKPETLYEARVSLAIEDRAVFNYLDLAYPSMWTRQEPDIRDPVDFTKGIWSGLYYVTVDGASILPPIIKDSSYRSPSDVDPFTETTYFQTRPGQFVSQVRVRLSGFEGKLIVDGLSIKEASTFIDDAVFRMPVPEGFEGMRITEVDEVLPAVSTNTARYAFSERAIECTREGRLIATIGVEPPVLGGLVVTRTSGNVVLENEHVLISVGADSVLLFKAKTGVRVAVSGPRRVDHLLEAGVLYVADGREGVLLAPLRPPLSVRAMPYSFDARDRVFDYDDADFDARGEKTWTLVRSFDEPEWQVAYDVVAGRGLTAQVFPPKSFDEEAYCTERMHTMNTNTVRSPEADFRYHLQEVGAKLETGLVWMSSYAASTNDLDPPDEYCLNADREPVHCDSSEVVTRQPVGIRFDVTGPYRVAEPAAFQRLVDQAHARGMRLIVYMSPHFYYTSDVDTFLADLQAMVDTYGVDGVYFDGLYDAEPLRSLELVRRTRALLGDGFYAQHVSWVNTLVRRTHRYRVPFLEAQADVVWLGEGVKVVDDATWRNAFCGRGVSNTPSMLLAELRPVDWTADRETSMALSLSPAEQVSRTLACRGLFRTTPYGEVSTIHDTHFQVSVPFESAIFLEPYNASCLPFTCGNGRCDAGESVFDCPADCAPVDPTVVQSRDGDVHRCPSGDPVAQWLLDGEPLHVLHYAFDGFPAGDSSGYEQHPDHAFGDTSRPPEPTVIGGREAYAFDGASYLFGGAKAVLDLTDKPFSMFATLRVDEGTGAAWQSILSFHPAQNLELGVRDGRFTVDVRDGDKRYGTEDIVDAGCYRGRCAEAQHNDATWQGISQTVGELLPGRTYTLTAMFRTAAAHDGYISLHDRDWKNATCVRVGRSFTARLPGDDDWRPIQVEAALPVLDDCGETTADDSWSVLLYTHSPLTDNSPIAYDEVRLTADDAPEVNVLVNPGFEDGFEGWGHSSYIARATFASTTNVADGEWHAVGVSYEPPRLALFVDGRQEVTGTIRVVPFDRLGSWAIGSNSTAGAVDPLVGAVDDLFVSARALSPEQVVQYAADGLHSLSYDGDAECVLSAGDRTYRAARLHGAFLPLAER